MRFEFMSTKKGQLNIKMKFLNCAEEAYSVFHFEGKQFKGKESDPPKTQSPE